MEVLCRRCRAIALLRSYGRSTLVASSSADLMTIHASPSGPSKGPALGEPPGIGQPDQQRRMPQKPCCSRGFGAQAWALPQDSFGMQGMGATGALATGAQAAGRLGRGRQGLQVMQPPPPPSCSLC